MLDRDIARLTELNPSTWFDTPPGADGSLIHREAIREWLALLASNTGIMHLTTFGTSTEGRELDAVFIGDALDGDRFDELATTRQRVVSALMRGATPPPWTQPVVLITSGIHATEVGGPQSIPELVYWLATSDEPEVAAIRERVLTIIVPTLNPDGMNLVTRWNDRTTGTDAAGSLPPLLYHRFAGHDNNRDWLYRNLVETRALIDNIHNTWLPHVTLDQHQMNQHGPRFALPPYADPWEPHVHPSIIAASSRLGQAIAADLTTRGMAGVMTGKYFDAWEPSRAIQHYRGGVRVLAEAANANLAHPTNVSVDQLTSPPLPQQTVPTGPSPLPWPGGTWRLRDTIAYHLEAAKSLLRHVSHEPDRWPALQQDALGQSPSRDIVISIPLAHPAPDIHANRRLASLLAEAGVALTGAADQRAVSVSLDQPMGAVAAALLLPKAYPEKIEQAPYDVTTHHLPLTMGALVHAESSPDGTQRGLHQDLGGKRYLAIDARCHAAPEAIEAASRAGRPAAWRSSTREVVDGTLVDAGTWIIDRTVLPKPEVAERIARISLPRLPGRAAPVRRRDVVLLNTTRRPTADHGWTRWWLQGRAIPFLEADAEIAPSLTPVAPSTTAIVPDTPRNDFNEGSIDAILELMSAGANVIAFGAAGRALAEAASASITVMEMTPESNVQAPGALVRLLPDRSCSIGMGLDRAIPAMFQRDGVFQIEGRPGCVDVLARFAAGDVLVSGWMSDTRPLHGAPAVVRVERGAGSLVAFSFRPIFRAQTLVTAPLFHNVLYSASEARPCLHFDQEKTPAGNTSAPTS
jgi:hypothetical protein